MHQSFPPALLAASLLTLSGVALAGDEREVEQRIERRILVHASPKGRAHVRVAGHGRGFLGAQLVDITPELRAHYGAPEDAGVLVSKVVDESPARAADLRVGDVISAVDGEAVDSPWDLMAEIRGREDGDRVVLEVWREGRRLELTPTLEERKHALYDLGRHMRWMRNLGGGPPYLELEGVEPIDIDVDLEDVAERLRSIDWEDVARRLPHRELQDRIHTLERRLEELEEKLEAAEDR